MPPYVKLSRYHKGLGSKIHLNPHCDSSCATHGHAGRGRATGETRPGSPAGPPAAWSCCTTPSSNASLCVHSPRDVIPNLNVLWSSGTTWPGISAEAYHLEEVETPPFERVDHSVVINLSTPAFVELKIDGQCDARKRVPGDLAILPASAVRQVRSRDPHEVLVVTVSPEVIAQTGLAAAGGKPIELIPRAYHRDAQLEHICLALKAEAESHYVSGPLYGESLALAVCVHLLKQTLGKDSSMPKKGGIAPRALRRVIDYIESNLDSPLRMASLAEISGLSQYRFAHNFKSATGVPPYQYVLRTRLDRAKQMLRQTNLSVLDIAYAVGCQSISRFNALFRRELGTTPTNYRASFR
jgi:AraC family transcriptional regulator